MADITVPESIRGVEQVRSVRTPAALDYTFTAGEATTRFLKGIKEKRIMGERAAGGKVYVPSRGADPQLGVPTSEQVELPHVGTLTSFCVVNVAFYGQGMEIPYTSGLILLDGADLRDCEALDAAELKTVGFDSVDYVAIRDAETLAVSPDLTRRARVLAAATIGRTRLIDNMPV